MVYPESNDASRGAGDSRNGLKRLGAGNPADEGLRRHIAVAPDPLSGMACPMAAARKKISPQASPSGRQQRILTQGDGGLNVMATTPEAACRATVIVCRRFCCGGIELPLRNNRMTLQAFAFSTARRPRRTVMK